MNIKILDSWLRDYLDTKATVKEIAQNLSLTSVSVDRIEEYGKNDYIYDIEVTTNRPDLMSVIGIAREAATILPQFGIEAKFKPLKLKKPTEKPKEILPIKIENDPSLVNRINAVIMNVELKQSPTWLKERLEASGIRSLNNIIDITNYVMREIGHPAHVFDYDRLTTKTLIIRESKPGEKIKTLDGKVHTLKGGDIIADNGQGEIEDLLGVMGTENSVVTDETKKIVFFLDNNEPYHIRKTSMNLGIRTEAAVLNEKGIDTEFMQKALLRGIELYKEIANGELASNIIDIYPNKPKIKKLTVSKDKIDRIIGIEIPLKISVEILEKLGFTITIREKSITVTVPTFRNNDIEIEEDIIEEIARVYGYHKLPNVIPPLRDPENYHQAQDPFFWERKVRNSLKNWGHTEVYTYSMVSEELLEGPTSEALQLANPLTEDMVYMRKTLVPSLLQVIRNNENHEEVKIFELSNIYIPRSNNLPEEILTLAGVIKKKSVSFYELKGLIEQLMVDLGIKHPVFAAKESGGVGTDIYIGKEYVGQIEILDFNIGNFELNFEILKKHATLKKVYKPIAKFPPVIEDVRLIINPEIKYNQIASFIKEQSHLVKDVSLLDVYQNKKTFRIVYQDPNKTLTNDEIAKIREKIYQTLEKEFGAKIS